jgi:TolB protein
MTRTFVARSFLTIIGAFGAVYLSSSFHAASSLIGTGSCVESAQHSASPAPTPLRNASLPVVSLDGSRIAFTSDRGGAVDLFVISRDGSHERQLTQTTEAEGNLAWTANSKQILFSVFKDDRSRLYAIDLDGRNQSEIVNVQGRAPTLSPDGRRLLYMSGTWTATRLMVSAVDGSNAKQITDGSSIAWNTHWSPDGKRIAFTGRDNPQSELAVLVMNADGSLPRKVTNISREEGGAQWPVWSPDGRRLAIQVNNRVQRNSAHIWIVDVTTAQAQKLAAHAEAYLDEAPSWFPDGKQIAFQSNRTGRMEVWVMKTDGSGARQITGAPMQKGSGL